MSDCQGHPNSREINMPDDSELYDVLCYGTISVENVTHLPYLPTPRRDAPAQSDYDELGGEAAHVAVFLATWGLHVLLVGNVIGTDRKGDFIIEELKRYPSIDTRYLRRQPDVVTPFSRILVTPDGDRSRIAYWYDQTPKVELTAEMMCQARLLSVDAYGQEERDRAAEVARALDKAVIAADAIWPQYPLASLSDVNVISKVWLQTNFPVVFDYDHSLELQAQGTGVVTITDGARPVLVVRRDSSAFGVEPYEIAGIIDTSGAGDVFKAGMIYSWLQPEWPLELKVQFACAAAGLNCGRDRTVDPPPSLAQIFALIGAQPR
jgi:sugar/nucleoside kinase (ribokinase family)